MPRILHSTLRSALAVVLRSVVATGPRWVVATALCPVVAAALTMALSVAVAPATASAQRSTTASVQTAPPAWTHGATCYEVFIRSFADGNGDGIGDLKGLTAKLDYINDGKPRSSRSLGARCIWLMPVAESPSYHGYDVSNYYRVEPDYGTNADFTRFMTEAHRRGIRVLVDMVLNHSSDRHPHFLAALRDTTSPYRAWYRWSPTKPSELNPWGQSNWHKSPVRNEWYYGFFSDHMPDLNYNTPAVREEAKRIAKFWLDSMHVDGFRLDAIPYLVEEPGHIVHSPGTHAVLREYGTYVRAVNPRSYTVGEVSDSTAAMLSYYPDQLDANFAFEVADSIIAGVKRGSAAGILPPVLRIQAAIRPDRIAPFLSNHDQPRVRTDLGGDIGKSRVAAFVLLTLPGMPFVYYGEEIGMTGAKPDERLRTPMQWRATQSGGFSTARAWEALQPDSMTVTVEAEDRDSTSLLAYYRRLIHLRANDRAIGSGEIVPLTTSNPAVTAYLRHAGRERVLVVANVGATAVTGLTLSAAAGALPAGRWRMRSLLGGAPAARLNVGRDGQVTGYAPLPALAAETGYLFELSPTKTR